MPAPSDLHLVKTSWPNSRSVAAKARRVQFIRNLPPGVECPVFAVSTAAEVSAIGAEQKSASLCRALGRDAVK